MRAVIGLEIHVELKTKSKMFCACDNKMDEQSPNSLICPICLGYPGVLPMANKEAILWTIKTGLTLNCQINLRTRFDRKHYFYPDLPKSFQISQYEQPISHQGWLEIRNEKGEIRKVGIRRVHLEEDTAKLVHPSGSDFTQIDFNRSGTPLMEIVTEPDIRSAKEAKNFSQKIRQILRYLGVSDADMEKGHFRCEANVSISKDKKEGTKVEVKNLNSFKSVEKAIEYEIERQKEIINSGQKVIQETRGWDDTKQITFSQRTKETAPDYRYFPEPDLPPFEFSESDIEKIKETLPELPDQKKERFIKKYKINSKSAQILVSEMALANFFEEVVLAKTNPQKAASWILTELLGKLREKGKTILENKIVAHDIAQLIKSVESGEISGKMAKQIFEIMFESGKSPQIIISDLGLKVISDNSQIGKIVNIVLNKNPKVVTDFKKGKKQALQFLIGQVMQKTKGRANPKIVLEILTQKLKGKNEKRNQKIKK